jgi:hypothetical protein
VSDEVEAAPEALAETNGHEELSFDSRVKLAGLTIFAKRNMVTEGAIDPYLVADEIQPTVVAAVAKVEKDREKLGATPTGLMRKHFNEVPQQSDITTDDPDELEYVDAVYGYVKTEVFRVLNVMPNGIIQQRLSENGSGLVLCRMKGRRGAEERAYVTRNKKLVNEDNNQPAYKTAARALARAAALTGMSIERIPEGGKYFAQQYNHATKDAITSGERSVQLALEFSTDSGSEESDEGDE